MTKGVRKFVAFAYEKFYNIYINQSDCRAFRDLLIILRRGDKVVNAQYCLNTSRRNRRLPCHTLMLRLRLL